MSRKKIPYNDNSIGGRLKTYWAHKSVNAKDFSDLLGISQGSLSDTETDKRFPPAKSLERIAHYTDLNIHWLYTGEGPMTRQGPKNEAEGQKETNIEGLEQKSYADIIPAFQDREWSKRIIQKLLKIELLLNEEKKEDAEKFLDGILEDNIIEVVLEEAFKRYPRLKWVVEQLNLGDEEAAYEMTNLLLATLEKRLKENNHFQ